METPKNPRRVRRGGLILASLLAAALGACIADPYKVSPPPDVVADVQASTTPEGPRRTTIAICYSRLAHTPAEVMSLARESCAYDGEVQRVAEDTFWNPCSVAHTSRAIFACTPGPAPPSKYN